MYCKVWTSKILFLIFVTCNASFACERKASRAELECNFNIYKKNIEDEIKILEMQDYEKVKHELQEKVDFLNQLKKDQVSFISYLQVVQKK